MGGRHPNGTLFESPTKFPSGMRSLADWLHTRGLKLGYCSAQLTRIARVAAIPTIAMCLCWASLCTIPLQLKRIVLAWWLSPRSPCARAGLRCVPYLYSLHVVVNVTTSACVLASDDGAPCPCSADYPWPLSVVSQCRNVCTAAQQYDLSDARSGSRRG